MPHANISSKTATPHQLSKGMAKLMEPMSGHDFSDPPQAFPKSVQELMGLREPMHGLQLIHLGKAHGANAKPCLP